MNMFQRFLKDESGATAIEYGLLAALLSIVIVGGAQFAGGGLDAVFTDVGNCLTTAAATTSGAVVC